MASPFSISIFHTFYPIRLEFSGSLSSAEVSFPKPFSGKRLLSFKAMVVLKREGQQGLPRMSVMRRHREFSGSCLKA